MNPLFRGLLATWHLLLRCNEAAFVQETMENLERLHPLEQAVIESWILDLKAGKVKEVQESMAILLHNLNNGT